MPIEGADRAAHCKVLEAAARARLDALAKPPGALGRLEDLAVRLCGASGTLAPQTSPRSLIVFAADHGAVASGVSLWPQAVSRAVTATVLSGGAGCSVLADATQTALRVVDVGLAGPPLVPHPQLTAQRVRSGTGDMAVEPALSPDEVMNAIAIGRTAAQDEIATGAKLLIAGDIGIGNTTAAAALTAYLCDADVPAVVGPGAGANEQVLKAKNDAIAAALRRAADMPRHTALAGLAGLEIAAMAGFYLEAAAQAVPVVLDGVISGAAALIALEHDPCVAQHMIAAHLSPEPAHAFALRRLNLTPFLDWRMRLGEGTGALTLVPQLEMAAALMTRMATLDDALALSNG